MNRKPANLRTTRRRAGSARLLFMAVVSLLEELADALPVAISIDALARWERRSWAILRLQQLHRSAAQPRKSLRQLAARIQREGRSIDPDWRCSYNHLQVWMRAFNAAGDDGCAAGLYGLLFPTSTRDRLHKPRMRPQRSGYGYRSPEAVAWFKRLYIDRKFQSVAACHRLTLAQAERRGWAWPRTVAATRAWLNREGRKGRPKGA